MQLDGSAVFARLNDCRDLLDEEFEEIVLFGVLIVEVSVFASDFGDGNLLHVVESFDYLGNFLGALDYDNGPFVAD
jgi:hypothetical protein